MSLDPSRFAWPPSSASDSYRQSLKTSCLTCLRSPTRIRNFLGHFPPDRRLVLSRLPYVPRLRSRHDARRCHLPPGHYLSRHRHRPALSIRHRLMHRPGEMLIYFQPEAKYPCPVIPLEFDAHFLEPCLLRDVYLPLVDAWHH